MWTQSKHNNLKIGFILGIGLTVQTSINLIAVLALYFYHNSEIIVLSVLILFTFYILIRCIQALSYMMSFIDDASFFILENITIFHHFSFSH